MSLIAENLVSIQAKLGAAILVAVSKTKPIAEIQAAFKCGARHFGENYLQEALPRIKSLQNLPITWHYLGRIQSKKIKDIVEYFEVVHSLDRLDHAIKFNEVAKELQKHLQVFVQVNLDDEPQKGGVALRELEAFVSGLKGLDHLEVQGLMLIPKPASPAETLQKFKALKVIGDALGNKTKGKLSMGMSHDYELALEAGASHIRIGTAIFGTRT